MNEDERRKAIEYYRTLVEKELTMEKTVDGKLIGPRKLQNKDRLELKDILKPNRPFLSKESTEDLDNTYVTTFRVGSLRKPISMSKSGYGSDLVGGIEFGENLVKEGLIKNIDDISSFLANYKIGIFDIFDEEETDECKKLDLRVYECIDCAGLPNIGEPICYFETGIIIGILRELTNKSIHAQEIRCWTSGYSFCQFEVEIND